MDSVTQATFNSMTDAGGTSITLASFYNILNKLQFNLTKEQTDKIFHTQFGANVNSINYTQFKNTILSNVGADFMPTQNILSLSFNLFTKNNPTLTDTSYVDNYVTQMQSAQDIQSFKDNLLRLANINNLNLFDINKYKDALTKSLTELAPAP